MCAKRKIIRTSTGDLFADELGKSTYKSKPKPWSQPEHITQQLNDRDTLIMTEQGYTPEQIQEALRQMGKFGSATPQKITTPEQELKRHKSKHAESDLQIKCLKWVKHWFPEDRTMVHKREGKRSGLNRSILKTFNNNSEGYPDHEFNCATHGLLYVEFKRPGEDWLLKDGITVKMAYRHQYAMHVQLWSEGKPAYFCNDYDKFRELYKAFKTGHKLPQQIYKY